MSGSHEKTTKFEKGGNCRLLLHRLVCRARARPRAAVAGFCRARWLYRENLPPEQIRSTRRTHRLARNARDPRGGERSESVRTRPRDRRFRSSARSRAHESRSGDAFDSALVRSPWAALGDRAEIRDDVGRGAIPPPPRDPPVVQESAGDRRRARDSSRRRRRAARRPPPTRDQRDRGFRGRVFGDERALALALPSTLSDPSPPPPSTSPPLVTARE